MSDFTPRLSKEGMLNSKYWYSNTNPFTLPDTDFQTVLAMRGGDFWEISNIVPHLPTGDGGQWWTSVSGYEVGQTPQLGAVMCFDDPNGAGHVAIVEEILANGDVISSNSGYSRNPGGYNDPNYFWTELNPITTNYRSNWEVTKGYTFQGFIYNPEIPVPRPTKRKSMPIYYSLRLF